MSLKKKIVLSLLLGAGIIAILSIFLYINFIEIKKEITFLELTDTIRSKSLQLRRHEKNFFLYAPGRADEESRAIHAYLAELTGTLKGIGGDREHRRAALDALIREYKGQFSRIESHIGEVSRQSGFLEKTSEPYARVARLIEANFLDKPLADAVYLRDFFYLPNDHPFITGLRGLDAEIGALRKTGESIIAASKELDKDARDKVDRFIRISRTAILIFFPLFILVGFGTMFFITGSIVKRLRLLTDVVEKAGKGNFSTMPVAAGSGGHDEVEILIRKFNTMEEELSRRERELLQSKKLAAIGTLAAGVAHELNNPLNNIYTTAQRLMKKSADDCPPSVKKGLDDIFGQTMRVKNIVGDLLEFARGREPSLRPVELRGLVNGVYKHLGGSIDTSGIRFITEFFPGEIVLYADQEHLERVFINLFANAVDAMAGSGDLTVKAEEEDDHVRISVSDTGRGIPRDSVEKIFEPFFTTKDKGTGLGLAIIFNIIQKHHGGITVESEEGEGTTFHVTLPKSAASGAGR